jgi:2-oxoglutarate ferredoxin oxidoreductase subunit gamma
MYHDVTMAGFGGQGILLIGNLLAEAALAEGLHVTYLPSYGVEMRGGSANCTVVISDQEIGSPAVGSPRALLVMSRPALFRFQASVKPGGLLIVNTSLIEPAEVERRDVELLAYPLNQIALELSHQRLANMVALGLYLGRTRVVALASIEHGFEELLSEKNRVFIPQNVAAIQKGMALAAEAGGKS